MGSDEVNSIHDNPEAMDVAIAVRTTYFDIVSQLNLPEHYELFKLVASGDGSKPCLMTKPSTIDKVLWIQYMKTDASGLEKMQGVYWKDPSSFTHDMHDLTPGESNVGSMVVDGITYYFYNDRDPEFYTSYDDVHIVFDGYRSDLEATLQNHKTLAYGSKEIAWEMEDNFIPDIATRDHTLLLNEAKALAFAEIKQTQHASAERNARRHRIRMQKDRFDVAKPKNDYPNYGRK
jgi:hypothetical protein